MIFHEGIFFIVRYISFGLEPTVLRAEIVDFVETRLESRLTTFFACGDRLATYCPYCLIKALYFSECDKAAIFSAEYA